MRKLAVGIAIALLALTAATAHAATGGITPQTYTDPAGDSGAAPDITAVAVGNDAAGQYDFDVTFATDYVGTAQLYLYLDTDRNTGTGDTNEDGADYLIFDDDASSTFEVDSWNGADWTSSSYATASVAADPRSLEISINKSELGDATSFDFFVGVLGAALADATGPFDDDAPSGSGTFVYELQQPLTLSVAATTTLAQRKAHRLNVGIAVRRSDTGRLVGGEDGTLACSGTAGKAKLRLITRAFISGGAGKGSAAVCQFALPKTHVRVVARITVTVDGVSVTKTVHTTS
jgi:hypothetical protein